MWIFLNDSFLSIAHHGDPTLLLVRARAKDDVERVFAKARVSHTPQRDYAYRAEIGREEVAKVLARRIEAIDYTNFKNSVAESDRHNVYLDVWEKMGGFQNSRRAGHHRR